MTTTEQKIVTALNQINIADWKATKFLSQLQPDKPLTLKGSAYLDRLLERYLPGSGLKNELLDEKIESQGE